MSLTPAGVWPTVRVTEVDGVPTVWLPAPGPLRARLAFRVGTSDEPLPWRGVSHLVQRLAGPGGVDRVRTWFDFTGTADELAPWLASVTAQLRGGGDVAAARAALRARTEGFDFTFLDTLACLRWGLDGYGAAPHLELGLEWLGPVELDHWRARWFTTDNAVLSVLGTPPEDLRIPLPAGVARPQQDAAPSRPASGPRWSHAKIVDGVALAGVGPRSASLRAAVDTLRHRGNTVLDGVAHHLAVHYLPISPDLAAVTMTASGETPAVLERLLPAVSRPEPVRADEVDAWRGRYVARLLDEERAGERLAAAAAAVLARVEMVQVEVLRDRAYAVTPAEATDELTALLAEADLVVPAGVTVEGWQRHRPESPVLPTGREFTSTRPSRPDDVLTVGPSGVQLESFPDDDGPGWRRTVVWADVLACLRLPDGTLRLFVRDGRFLAVPPAHWTSGATAAVLAWLSPSLVVDAAGGP